ncbi:MAG TPA: pyridoxamine 5'-phosphate oxidase family protein [Bellilinea sp.]|nr:pyridoxamine 5'-phosphate oxidase family protein [Bellilinea sp.]
MKIKVSRPKMPKGYIGDPKAFVTWESTGQRLVEARNYWVCTADDESRPHVIPVWGAWVENAFYFDGSSKTKHLRNIAENPEVAIHLESGSQVLILYGRCHAVAAAEAPTEQIASQYRAKYAENGYAPEADQWNNGGLYRFVPVKVITWTEFSHDPTKFILSQ